MAQVRRDEGKDPRDVYEVENPRPPNCVQTRGPGTVERGLPKEVRPEEHPERAAEEGCRDREPFLLREDLSGEPRRGQPGTHRGNQEERERLGDPDARDGARSDEREHEDRRGERHDERHAPCERVVGCEVDPPTTAEKAVAPARTTSSFP